MDQFWNVTLDLLEGFGQNCTIFGLTLLMAIPLGLIISFGSMSKFLPIKAVVKTFVWIIRGTPLMLQLFVVFYLPSLAWGVSFDRMTAAIIAFVINYAAYFSEIFRGGIEGIPKGQYEAGQVLGMTKSQIFFKIVLMQVVKRIVAPMSNEIITLVKDTSLARIIALQEVIWAGQAFMKGSQGISGAIWPLFFTGAYYLAFSGILTLLFGWIEKKLSYFKA